MVQKSSQQHPISENKTKGKHSI